MAGAPVVQSLNDLIAEQNTALQPEQSQLDTQIAANDTSGTAQVAGLDAAKTTAFKGITQAANDRGGYFSGFTPTEEAGYTGSTYLPALAKLQSTIDSTKNTLLGQKANLTTTANTNALGEQKNQQAQLDAYNNALATAQATADAARERDQTTLTAAEIRAGATTSAAATRAAASAASKAGPVAQQRAGNGFNFTDASGKPISARTYAALTGTNFNSLVTQMAQAGDAGAKAYLKSGGKAFSSALSWS